MQFSLENLSLHRLSTTVSKKNVNYIYYIVVNGDGPFDGQNGLVDRLGSEPIMSVKWSVSIGTVINFDGDTDGTCKQTLRPYSHCTSAIASAVP